MFEHKDVWMKSFFIIFVKVMDKVASMPFMKMSLKCSKVIFRTKQHSYFWVSTYFYNSKTILSKFQVSSMIGTSSKDDEVDGKMLG
jgi:hypothetical protein